MPELFSGPTPKLTNGKGYNNSHIYKYYAGYSDLFVKAQIEKLLVTKKNGVILDPWNGSGTTTLVSSLLGYKSYGFDINPVMVIVAKAKLYYPDGSNIIELSNTIKKSLKIKRTILIQKEDPLFAWFDESTIRSVRKLERVIRNSCTYSDNTYMKFYMNMNNISCELSFYYVVLFELLRTYTNVFIGSNPTWLKVASSDEEKIHKSYKDICGEYIECLNRLSQLLDSKIDHSKAIVQIGDSRNIYLADESVDCIISSPPYCTRIDYAIYTRVELALIGYSHEEFDKVRRGMIGTPTVSSKSKEQETCECLDVFNDVLQKISNHNSKAAQSYYYKTFYQYFFDMDKSVAEIARVLKQDGVISIVLQDTWFKNVHIDTPNIIRMMFEKYGLKLLSINTETVTNNMRYINTRSKKYGSNINHESVLIMSKMGV